MIFFEGTYSATFSGNPNPTPRYDYNQLMYKLDLSDPRLACRRSTRRPSSRQCPLPSAFNAIVTWPQMRGRDSVGQALA